MQFGLPLISPTADRTVDPGDRLELAGFSFEVREIPGHSPGSVVYVCRDFEPNFVLGGDVLFAGSVGRTDLVYGDGPMLFSGIKSKLLRICPTRRWSSPATARRRPSAASD